jgi:hypothetical protein
MKKKIIIVLLLLVFGLATVTMAYMVTRVKTNETLIQLGGPDAKNATLTPLYLSDVRLVPKDVTTTSDKEVKYLQWELTVEADGYIEYGLDTELPPEFVVTTNKVAGYNFNSDTTYIVTLELLEEVDYSDYTFYLYITIK